MEQLKAPIAYEYGGNCYSKISFDQKRLAALLQITDSPRRTLIIREGSERRDDFITIPFMHQGWPKIFPFLERKREFTTKQTENAFVLTINPQVIDGRIQEIFKDFNTVLYKKAFAINLADIISMGIRRWSEGEMDEMLKGKSLWDKVKAKYAFSRFWQKNENQIVTWLQ